MKIDRKARVLRWECDCEASKFFYLKTFQTAVLLLTGFLFWNSKKRDIEKFYEI